MGNVRTLLEHLRHGRRPPTGPLTTAEQATADELQTGTALEESESDTRQDEAEGKTSRGK